MLAFRLERISSFLLDVCHPHKLCSVYKCIVVVFVLANMKREFQVSNMSNTSEEESHTTSSHHQPNIGINCITLPSKGDAAALPLAKKRRSLPGNPDPDAEAVALSPRTLLATNRYICEVCLKGFQRDQNLQLHRRGHNLPWKLKQRTTTEVKKRVYVCPEVTCTHHDPSRALGDLTGIKKHYSRKHGEKKWKCDKCSKRYAVQSDWKAHAKICGTKEYRCDCGTIFSRKDSFITHRAFCDALAEENYRANHGLAAMVGSLQSQTHDMFSSAIDSTALINSSASEQPHQHNNVNPLKSLSLNPFMPNAAADKMIFNATTSGVSASAAYMSATALLQKAAEMGAKVSDDSISPILLRGFTGYASMPRPVREPSQGTAAEFMQSGSTTTFAPVVAMSNGGSNCNEMVNVGGRDVRMTQDFLGLGPLGHGGAAGIHGESSFGEGLSGYSDGQQGSHHGVYAYQHVGHGTTTAHAVEKPVWGEF